MAGGNNSQNDQHTDALAALNGFGAAPASSGPRAEDLANLSKPAPRAPVKPVAKPPVPAKPVQKPAPVSKPVPPAAPPRPVAKPPAPPSKPVAPPPEPVLEPIKLEPPIPLEAPAATLAPIELAGGPIETNEPETADSTGFAAILANKKPAEEAPPLANIPLPPEPLARPAGPGNSGAHVANLPTPKPRGEEEGEGKSSRVRSVTDQIGMAKEIKFNPTTLPAQVEQAPPAGVGGAAGGVIAYNRPRPRKVPSWYRAVIPVLFTVASLLFVLGLWGVLVKMKVNGIPLFDAGEESANPDAFSTTQTIGLLMACVGLPLAAVLIALGVLLGRSVRHAEAEAENAAALAKQ